MILSGIKYLPQEVSPEPLLTLVWLHGFLGRFQEWRPIIRLLPNFSHLLLDLPGHGQSACLSVTGFADMDDLLRATLHHHQIKDYLLIGYSLGARIAMYHACQGAIGLRALLVEGGHPGLAVVKERQERVAHDARWAMRFRQETLTQVLQDWYQQNIFAYLNVAQREAIVIERSRQSGQALATLLEAASLGKQPFLIPGLRALTIPFCYVCGERDRSFLQLAKYYRLPLQIILEAGHNAHRADPLGFIQQVRHFLMKAYF